MQSPNPYASPRTTSRAGRGTSYNLRTVIVLYRWIGVAGAVVCSVGNAVFALLVVMGDADMPIGESIFIILICGLYTAFFVICFRTARRLARTPAGMHRRTRWLGFIMAVLFSPLLTFPGLYAVLKIDRYFAGLPNKIVRE